jgi:hypothetical protein
VTRAAEHRDQLVGAVVAVPDDGDPLACKLERRTAHGTSRVPGSVGSVVRLFRLGNKSPATSGTTSNITSHMAPSMAIADPRDMSIGYSNAERSGLSRSPRAGEAVEEGGDRAIGIEVWAWAGDWLMPVIDAIEALAAWVRSQHGSRRLLRSARTVPADMRSGWVIGGRPGASWEEGR